MSIHIRTVIFGLLLYVLSCISVLGCECEIRKHGKDFRKAIAVFTGTITAVNSPTAPADISDMRPQSSRLIELHVDARYKGSGSDTEHVWSYEIPSACGGFEFKVGEKYLLYVYRAEKGSHYVTTACTRSGPISANGKIADELRDLNRPSFRFWSRVWPF